MNHEKYLKNVEDSILREVPELKKELVSKLLFIYKVAIEKKQAIKEVLK